MNNQDLIFASLVGSNFVKVVPRLQMTQNELENYVLPRFPLSVTQNKESIKREKFQSIPGANSADPASSESEQYFPLKLSIDEGKTWFLLPYEPMVSISGKNNVIMRNVAKWTPESGMPLTGTIKERWSQDDYQIQITGFLMGSILTGTVEQCYPREQFEMLKNVLTHSREIRVLCPPLELLGISKIVVLDFSFPFTKGENVQAYDIKAVSDFSYNLLVDV